jgi:hypothetical protein
MAGPADIAAWSGRAVAARQLRQVVIRPHACGSDNAMGLVENPGA